jgi:hypothetical protein
MARKGLISLHPNTIGSFDFLKKHFVLYDELVVAGAREVPEMLDGLAPGFAEELETLLDSKILIDISDIEPDESDFEQMALNNSDFSRIFQEKKLAENEHEKSLRDPFSIKDCVDKDNVFDFDKFITSYTPLRNIVKIEHLREKLISEFLNISSQDTYSPILYQQFNTGYISNADVVNLAIAGFPVIRDDVEWEKIRDFKNEDETKIKIMRFREFAKKISREKLTAIEAQEEIEWMLEEYKQHIKLAKMKYELGKIEGIFLTSLKFVENLLTFKPSEAFGSLYTIKKNRIELLEAELNSPGKEVALLASFETL